jgi:hypothetical protein
VITTEVFGELEEIENIGRLMSHNREEHNVTEEKTSDVMQFFIATMFSGRLKVCLREPNGTQMRRRWEVEICHYPHCNHVNLAHNSVDVRLKRHPKMQENIDARGWIWCTIRRTVQHKQMATIAEVLGEGKIYQCSASRCWNVFASERGIAIARYSHRLALALPGIGSA